MKLRHTHRMPKYLRRMAMRLQSQVNTLFLAYADKRTPWYAKVWVVIVLCYALSPIDLLPDFIPVLGLLDDLVLIPLGVAVAIRLVPRTVWSDCERKVLQGVDIPLRYRRIGMLTVLLLWSTLLFTMVHAIFLSR